MWIPDTGDTVKYLGRDLGPKFGRVTGLKPGEDIGTIEEIYPGLFKIRYVIRVPGGRVVAEHKDEMQLVAKWSQGPRLFPPPHPTEVFPSPWPSDEAEETLRLRRAREKRER